MLILAVDTSTSTTSLALLDGDDLLAGWHQAHRHPPSDSIFPRVEEALESAGVAPKDIRAYAACTGPGSFTGLRIGLGLAKTMAYVHRAAVVGIDAVTLTALEAAALGALEPGVEFTAAVHGFRSTTFSARFVIDSDGVTRGSELAYHDDEAALVAAAAGAPIATREGFPFTLEGHVLLAGGETPAAVLARAAARRVARDDATPFHELQPLYLKPFSVGKKAKAPEDLR